MPNRGASAPIKLALNSLRNFGGKLLRQAGRFGGSNTGAPTCSEDFPSFTITGNGEYQSRNEVR